MRDSGDFGPLQFVLASMAGGYSHPSWFIYGQHPVWSVVTLCGPGAQAVHRRPGSIGGCATPARVFKGTRMAGRMGNDRVTMQNLLVHKVDAENGVLLIKGAVPGRTGGLVMVRSAIKRGEK